MMSKSICWYCQNSTNSGCPWSRNFIPVPGWQAEKTNFNFSKYDNYKSYIVKECPLFVQDKNTKIMKEVMQKFRITENGYYRLIDNGKIDKFGNVLKNFRISNRRIGTHYDYEKAN